MVQMPKVTDGWLDDDEAKNGDMPDELTTSPRGTGDIDMADGIFGGLDSGTLAAFRQTRAHGQNLETPDRTDGGYGASSLQPPKIAPRELNPADADFQMPDLPPAGAGSPSKMSASPRLVEFLKGYEKGPDGGPALTPYPSPEGGSDTVGWGHKIQPGEDYSKGLTPGQADQLLLKDIAGHQKIVQESVKVPLSQQQFDALVSLSYNLPKAFNAKHSEMLRDLNRQDYPGAADQFPRWNRAGGAVMPGLTERRDYERNMFLNGVYTNHK